LQTKRSLTKLSLNVSSMVQTQFARYMIPSTALMLAAAAVASILNLAGHIHATLPILSYVMGHVHATISAPQGGDPWPP